MAKTLKKGKRKIKTNDGRVQLNVNDNRLLVTSDDSGEEKFIAIIGDTNG